MYQKIKRVIYAAVLMIAAVTVSVCIKPAAVQASSEKTVRVGIFSLGKFMDWDEDGNAVGYNIDFLNKIAEQTHWSYEYVPCDNWIDATEKLENGEIDLLAPAQITEALSEKFDYASLYMGTEAAAIYTKADRQLLYEDFGAMNDLTYGCAENSTFARKFVSEYCVEHHMNPKIIYYANTTELQEAIEKDEVDAIVTNIMFASDTYEMLGWYSLMPVYYIARPENQTILTDLDNAMMQILAVQPDYIAGKEAEYFPIFDNNSFTYEEQQFIDNLPVIKVGYETDHEPLSYTDAETGEFAGIARDILDQISRLSGIRFEYVALPTENLTFAYLRENDIYVLSDMADNSINNSASQLTFSEVYLKADKVMIVKKSFPLNQTPNTRIARVAGPNTLASTQQAEPGVTYTDYSSVDAAMKAVQKDEATSFMINRYAAETAMENPAYSDLLVVSASGMTDNKCLTTVTYENDTSETAAEIHNKLFLSVLNKAIMQLSQDEVNAAILKYTVNRHYQYTLLDILRLYWRQIAVFAVLMLACILLLLYARNIEAARKRELAVKSVELEGKNHDLMEAVDAAERANSAKSQFLSRMSHEIRTPMNAIVGLTTIARHHKQEPERVDEYLTKIEASSKVLLNIINDVLDMSAIESDKLKIANSEFDIKQVLNGISTIYYSQCRDKGIDFKMGVDVSDEMLIGDSLRVNQILMNLVSNAFKFTDAGGEIEITVKQINRKGKQVFLRFEVADTGSGMTPQMLERLFKPFEQESAMTAQKHGGSGLGMSIAKNLVDMMQGAISVQSEKGVGTTFTVDLPFETTEHSSMIDPDRLKEMHALIVDDDETARKYTSVIVGRVGIDFDVAASGREAIEMMKKRRAQNKKYDLCFVDWKMPDMNGVELTREIRETFNEEPVVIIVSAYDLSEVETEAKEAGADLFISKPLFQSTVFNALIQITGGVVKNTDSADKNYDFTGHKLLLAEDNELNTEIAIELLDMVNMQVDHAGNGEEAVKMFQEAEPGTYDLILMDIQMPLLDGYGAARAIRDLGYKEAETIPIFAMTANAFTEDVSHSLSAGMNGHISKPIDTAVLYSTIYKIINSKQE